MLPQTATSKKWREMAELTEISRFDAGTNFKLDRLWSEFEDAWHTIYTSEEVRDLAAGALSIARDLVEKRAEVIAGVLGGAEPRSRLRPVA